jgi:hypothetical protein
MLTTANSVVVVIEGDETVNPDRLTISTNADIPHVQLVFACRDTPGYVERLTMDQRTTYVSKICEALKLVSVIAMCRQVFESNTFVLLTALEAAKPDFALGISALTAIIDNATRARAELCAISSAHCADMCDDVPRVGMVPPTP